MKTKTPAGASGSDITDARRTAYLVLGMHRSGTSAVTQMLALAGAELPENVMAGDEHNARGYFEPWKIAVFNDERLRAARSAWDDVFAYPHQPLPREDERRWLNEAMALVNEEYGLARWPLLKDPRVTLLLPFWRSVLDDLGIGARCVIPVRNPLDVAGSLATRNGFAPEKSVLLWVAYMLAAEVYSRDLPRAFVSYDALLSDWRAEAARIEAAHGAPLPNLDERAEREIDRFLSPDLRHNAGAGELAALGWVGALAGSAYDWFLAAARGGSPDQQPLIAAAEALDQRRREIGPLITPVSHDLDVARAKLLDATQLVAFERNRRQGMEREIHDLRTRLEGLRATCDEAAANLAAVLDQA